MAHLAFILSCIAIAASLSALVAYFGAFIAAALVTTWRHRAAPSAEEELAAILEEDLDSALEDILGRAGERTSSR